MTFAMSPEETSGLINLPANLETARITSLPASAYYIADFISESEEQLLLGKVGSTWTVKSLQKLNCHLQIAAAPKPCWKVLAHRRLQTWPSELTKDTLLDSSLPEWLINPVVSRICSLPQYGDASANIFFSSPHSAPNHVLVNEYLPGQGIMPHKDGAAYHPVVCTVSLGGTLCLDIYGCNSDGTRETTPKTRIVQEPRSLLVTTGEIYTECMHGIADTTMDTGLDSTSVANWSLLRSPELIVDGKIEREIRTSLTYRDVIKVSKLGKTFAAFGRR
jgi:alkylated DNA repair protein alkB family protein 6